MTMMKIVTKVRARRAARTPIVAPEMIATGDGDAVCVCVCQMKIERCL